MFDFNFTGHGSITLITPSGKPAEDECWRRFGDDTQRFGLSYACEPRYAPEIAADLCRDGWTCSLDGFELILRDPEPPHSGLDDEASPSEIRRDWWKKDQ